MQMKQSSSATLLKISLLICIVCYIHWWPFLGMLLPEKKFVTYNFNSISLHECACVYSFELYYILPMSIK
jgi:hypothetical protein